MPDPRSFIVLASGERFLIKSGQEQVAALVDDARSSHKSLTIPGHAELGTIYPDHVVRVYPADV